ncbi:uncharacterized protein EV422DRAFT_154846 [Fimicolochytrium jonesii]|uniref:uncharacterized protein n=1 Tax=Fimicolochytrium jonesii TaxID=1396493 RepID=UPI0022FDD702|nr:uncharacterized protein EV422DRAFT_154846 [Fimicolochytrium jonesii]KAI8826119.1 hypothetical protein EV422DRAFT_154846 [Fimicolochytrium jonesii]
MDVGQLSRLVVRPPLPRGVDEADLLIACEEFEDFTQIFWFPHFHLICFTSHANAVRALGTLNLKLNARVKLHWDKWSFANPKNGPFPIASVAVESPYVYIPRNFLPVSVVKKIAQRQPGYDQGRAFPRGNVVKFKSTHDAFSFIDYLTSKTNLLPYFVDRYGNPTEPISKLDDFGDYLAEQNGKVTNPDLYSKARGVRVTPYGDEPAVLMHLLSSFWGWQRVDLLSEIECIATFSDPPSARRFFRYIEGYTPATAEMVSPPERAPFKMADANPSAAIQVDLKETMLFNTNFGKKRSTEWLGSYENAKEITYSRFEDGTSIAYAEFKTIEAAQFAAEHINLTTNLEASFVDVSAGRRSEPPAGDYVQECAPPKSTEPQTGNYALSSRGLDSHASLGSIRSEASCSAISDSPFTSSLRTAASAAEKSPRGITQH